MADKREDPRLLAGVEALLGHADEVHPRGGEVLALAEGNLAPAQAAALWAHLDSCALCGGLLTAARQGLEQAQADEQTARDDMEQQLPLLPLILRQPEQPRALAAGHEEEAAPLPADRQELLRAASGARAVYFRRLGRAKVGLFDAGGQGELCLTGRALDPEERGPDFQIFDLGPIQALEGQELVVRLGGEACRYKLGLGAA